ncbi:MAG: hypothetical protein AB9900_10490 [Humidesulfovibrio sp.]
MNVVDTINRQPQLEPADQRPQGVPTEPRLPAGKPLRSVQTMPLPLISQPESPKPDPETQTVRQQVARTRAEITGTGVILDIIA